LKVLKIKKKELIDFYKSTFYKNLQHIPLTDLRLNSYLNNPYSKKDSYVLYLFIKEQQIISYRTLLHDKLFDQQIIVWSSGSWTNPLYRNQGLSKALLLEVEKDYPKQSFIYTRSLSSKILYQNNTDLFFLEDRESKELHYNFNFLKKIFPVAIVNLCNRLFYRSIKNEFAEYFHLFTNSKMDNLTEEYLLNKSSNEFTPLSIEKLKWIKTYPWIKENGNLNYDQIYDFSYIVKKFYSDAFELRNTETITAFYYRNIREDILYLHYVYYDSEQEAISIAKAVLYEAMLYHINQIIVRDERVKNIIKNLQKPLLTKAYKNFLFVPKAYKKHLNKPIQHGIGEIIFT